MLISEKRSRAVSLCPPQAISLGFLTSGTVFMLMMLFGFRTFGLAAQPLLLNNYHKTADTMATLARLATGFSIVCGFPLMFAGLKTGLFSLFEAKVNDSVSLSKGSKDALLSTTTNRLISTVVLAAICGVACKCTEHDVGFVIGIIGAILGTGVVYMIPAMLNNRLLAGLKGAEGEKLVNRLLVAVGAVFAVIGTITALEEHFPAIHVFSAAKAHAH